MYGLRYLTQKSTFFILFISILALSSQAQSSFPCDQALEITKTAGKFHFQPREVNDEFSEVVFTAFLEQLDSEKMYFSKEDIQKLESYKFSIDEAILNQNCAFFEKITSLYQEKQVAAYALMDDFEDKILDFQKADTLFIEEENSYLSQNQLAAKWEQLLKIQILSSYLSNQDSSEIALTPTPEKISAIQKKILTRSKCRIQAKMNSNERMETYLGTMFLDAVASAFDPHTTYFPAETKNEFESMLSKEAYSYGIEIYRNQAGKVEIYSIIPGSLAWNTNALHEGDVVLAVKTPNGEMKDFDCLSMSEIRSFMASNEHNKASFHILKKSGQEVHVDLYKEKIEVEDNVISSFMLEGKNKIGYIHLPSFYSQMDHSSYLKKGSADDVATELIKLKREGMDGLLFDLRNNGGGSMREAIRLAGIFINFGAVAIASYSDGSLTTLKDQTRGSIFNKPLVILVNRFSASASELFAATMQDHNRGLIVGGETYGKSTIQVILPIESHKFGNIEQSTNISNPKAFVKLTTGGFFRVDGTTHQKTGVQPDIMLPTIYDKMEVGEGTNTSALTLSPVEKKTYYTPQSPLPIEELRNNK